MLLVHYNLRHGPWALHIRRCTNSPWFGPLSFVPPQNIETCGAILPKPASHSMLDIPNYGVNLDAPLKRLLQET